MHFVNTINNSCRFKEETSSNSIALYSCEACCCLWMLLETCSMLSTVISTKVFNLGYLDCMSLDRRQEVGSETLSSPPVHCLPVHVDSATVTTDLCDYCLLLTLVVVGDPSIIHIHTPVSLFVFVPSFIRVFS